MIFEIVDADKSNTIEFDELNMYYCKVNGIPEALSLPSGYSKKWYIKRILINSSEIKILLLFCDRDQIKICIKYQYLKIIR